MSDDSLATLLILSSALLHAIWNAAVKKSDDKFATVVFVTSYGGLLFIPFAAFAPFPEPALWGWIAASMASHLLYQLALAAALERGALTFIYPIARGTGPMLVVVFAYFILNDTLPPWKLAAIGLLVGGIFLSAGSLGKNANQPRSALYFALLTGSMIASYTVIDGLAVRTAQNPLSFILWSGISTAPMIFLVGIKRRGFALVSDTLKVWRQGVLASIPAHGGYALALVAYNLGGLGEIAALRETSIVFAALIGFLWLKEPFSRNKLASLLLIALGAILLKFL